MADIKTLRDNISELRMSCARLISSAINEGRAGLLIAENLKTAHEHLYRAELSCPALKGKEEPSNG